jgi:hypothetical protein
MSGEQTLFGQERWTATELGEALCLSTQRINQLVKEGVLPAPFDGRYAPREAVSRYVQHIRQRENSKTHAGEAVRKMQLENEMREIRLRKIADALVPVAQVQKDWFEVGRRIRDALLNLPSRLSGPFAAESNQEKIFALFTKEIHVVLTELSSGQRAVPSASRAPVGEVPEPEPSTDQTEAGEHDVQDPGNLDRESTQ